MSIQSVISNLLTSKQTKRFTVSAHDIAMSMYYFVGTSVAASIVPNLDKMTMPNVVQIKLAVSAGLVAGFQHLIRKYFTNEMGKLV
jgi:hypothetical protein